MTAPATIMIFTLSLHDALPISDAGLGAAQYVGLNLDVGRKAFSADGVVRLLGRMARSEEHTSELQSRGHLVCRLLLETKKIKINWVDIEMNIDMSMYLVDD